jgi:pimeloyl-ACP methyl ester carboxylesterase
MKKIWVPLAIIACVYLSLCGALFFFQRDLLYLPPAIHEHNYPSKSFSNESERIDVITLNTQHKKAILYFGGNSEAVVKNASTYIRNFPNHAIYLVNYRGYGSSTGQPTEAGIYSDALHIFDEIKSQHTTISIIGRSLGSGVATYVAANRNVEKLILITPYDSIESIAAAQYPIFPVSLLLLDKYHSDDRAKNIRAKTLILLAENDKVIPLVSSQRLIKQFNKALLTIKTIKNADHRNISSFDEYNVLMEEFMVLTAAVYNTAILGLSR